MKLGRAPETLAAVTLAVLSALLLYSVGRPVASADTWLHLALGEAYLQEGPWLHADPILHTATGPPVPAASLAASLAAASSSSRCSRRAAAQIEVAVAKQTNARGQISGDLEIDEHENI